MLNVPGFLLILNLAGVSYCCHLQDISKPIISDDYYYYAFIYPWLVVIHVPSDDLAVLYGGLIHPKAVLTCAYGLEGYNENNLVVETRCDENQTNGTLENCTTRNISKIIYSDDYDAQSTTEKSFALLILTTPFDINPLISPVDLINNMELVDKQSCFVNHWMRVNNIRRKKYGFVTEAFQVPYVDGIFRIDGMDKDQMKESRDYVIQENFTVALSIHDIGSLAFFGSPIICNGEDSMPYQVGIATFGMEVPVRDDPRPIKPVGSYFLISDYYDEIMKKLEENVS